MVGSYFLCVDCGLTTTTAVVITSEGEEAAAALAKTELIKGGDTSEIDMAAQWLRAACVMREALRKSGVRPGQIAAVGVSGHGGGLYPVDKDGAPVSNAFTSMDARALPLMEDRARAGVSCKDGTGHDLWPGQAVPQLAWLKANRRELYDRTRWALGAKDWIVFNLTAEQSMDYTDGSNSGFVGLRTGGCDPDILAAFDIEEAAGKLPRLSKSSDVVGGITAAAAARTGLAEGTPVIAGAIDVIACALGGGVIGERKYSMIAGTWNINTAFAKRLLDSPPSVKCSLGADPSLIAYTESSATSAGNLEWYVENVIRPFAPEIPPQGLYARINEEIDGIGPAESGVLFMPFIYRSHLSRAMDAGFIGIRAEHNASHLLRAVFEGVAFAHRRHLDILKAGSLSRRTAVLSGGAANSPVWCRMVADVTGLFVETTRVSQAGALGVAICAAVGVGLYGSLEEAASKMVRLRERYEPDLAAGTVYDGKYEEWSRVIDMFDHAEEKRRNRWPS
jgi:L-xylulokinase